METKHTPGPWKYGWETDAREWGIVTDRRGGIVANVNTSTGPDATSAPAMRVMPCEANARLIASAPELLEACEGLVEEIDAARMETLCQGSEWVAKLAKARAAIARATA